MTSAALEPCLLRPGSSGQPAASFRNAGAAIGWGAGYAPWPFFSCAQRLRSQQRLGFAFGVDCDAFNS